MFEQPSFSQIFSTPEDRDFIQVFQRLGGSDGADQTLARATILALLQVGALCVVECMLTRLRSSYASIILCLQVPSLQVPSLHARICLLALSIRPLIRNSDLLGTLLCVLQRFGAAQESWDKARAKAHKRRVKAATQLLDAVSMSAFAM